jgi:hypothetical protein
MLQSIASACLPRASHRPVLGLWMDKERRGDAGLCGRVRSVRCARSPQLQRERFGRRFAKNPMSAAARTTTCAVTVCHDG